MNNVKALLIIVLGLAAANLSAREYDLRKRNLAPCIEDMVKDAKEQGTYDELPAIIKMCHEDMEHGNYTVANIQVVNQVAEPVFEYLNKKSRA